MVSEFRIREAFHAVKKDISVLQAEVARLSKENSMLVDIVKKQTNALTKKVTTKKVAKKSAAKSSSKTSSSKTSGFVASKNGSKYHKITSPFAARIKKDDRVFFKTESQALKKGYTPSQYTK